MSDHYRDQLKSKPRFANGQEEIKLCNGGRYRIVAPTRGGARGHPNDDVIIDELREMVDHDFVASAEPTLSQSTNPQMLYLSNAGEDDSAVLNALRNRAGTDEALAYLEWSAAPERDVSDRKGWLEGNPAVGQLEGRDMMAYLERKFTSYRLAGTLSIFETEHLCRWVPSTRERLVDEFAWMACRKPLGTPSHPFMAVSTTPDGTRAAAVIAWQLADGSVALRQLHDVQGSPIDLKAFGKAINDDARRLGVMKIAHDPLTDAEIAKHLRKPSKITGQEFANATAQFVNLIRAGRLRWNDSDAISDDLAWTARKDHDDTGHFQAVRMADDRPIPASLAAIRAVWLASGPPPPSPRIY